MSVVQDAVALAIESLSWMEHEGLSERAAFAKASRQLGTTRTDQLRMAQMLILETSRRRNLIDHLIQRAIGEKFDLDSIKHGSASLLRLFCYWMKFHRSGERDAARILHAGRSALGWRALHPIEPMFGRIIALDITEELRKLPHEEAEALSIFHPAWFVSASTFLLGRPVAFELMRRNMLRASSYLRINTLQGSEEDCLREIKEAGIDAEPVDGLPPALRVLSFGPPIVKTKPYQQGRVTFQDKASILASAIAAPEPGDTVLDICAAPGEKTTHLAQLMENQGAVYSLDRSSARMTFWKREIHRLGVTIAHPIVADATKPIPIRTQVDVVLLDPPCSNTGTFWKSPAEKWTINPERVRSLARHQRAMLENASQHVREGGTLVYSTCSILAEENEQVINSFLTVNPDFRAVSSNPRIGAPGLYGIELGQRLYPHTHECNGHFLCKMTRTG